MRRAPAFWARRHSLAGWGLSPVAWIYGAIAAHRLHRRPSYTAPVPVICVGNFTLGGAGKTPTAIALGDYLRGQGRAPVFLTRGYGGRLAGPVVVDAEVHSAVDVGDEALLLARHAPTVVAADRAAGAKAAITAGADVIVMDDGFQNPSLAKTRSLVVVDAEAGIGNGRVFPAGPLRAPLDSQMAFADVVLLIGGKLGAGAVHVAAGIHGVPLLSARYETVNGADFAGARVLAYAGIARPEKFFRSLGDAGAEVDGVSFADHHPFTQEEAEDLLWRAETSGRLLVTTEKDHARLAGASRGTLKELADVSAVLRIRCVFDVAAALGDAV